MDNKDLEIKKVPFLGTELMAARDADGQIWAGVSYICRGIGLSKNEKDRQVKNVQTETVLKRGCVKFAAGVFDPNNETLALKLDFVPLWLAKISITPTMEQETPKIAETLMEYQLKAKDVLAAAFLPGGRGMSVPQTYAAALRALADEVEQKEALKQQVAVQNQQIMEMSRSCSYCGVSGDYYAKGLCRICYNRLIRTGTLELKPKMIKELPRRLHWTDRLMLDVTGQISDRPDDLEGAIDVILDTLTPKEKQVILMRYKDEKTLGDCGEELGVTRERIRQIQARATRKLRNPDRICYFALGLDGARRKAAEEEAQRQRAEEELRAQAEKEAEERARWIASFPLDAPLEDMKLSARAYNCLRRSGASTVKDVLTLCQKEPNFLGLVNIRNLGRKTCLEILSKLTEYLHLSNSDQLLALAG